MDDMNRVAQVELGGKRDDVSNCVRRLLRLRSSQRKD
jgi:hypothetical protein